MGARVRIAGAGLAGQFAAVRLAEAGLPVEVLETKNRIAASSGPHTEAVRDYLDGNALQELRRHGFDLEPFGTVETTVRRSEHFENVLRGRTYYLFMRGREPGTVDRELHERCLAAGVSLSLSSHWDPGAGADIVATGPPRDRRNIVGAGFTFSAKGSNLDEHTAYALLDNHVAPAGYLVITPGGDYHSLYGVSWRELGYDRLRRSVEVATGRPWVREILGSSRRLGRIHGAAHFSPDPMAAAERDGARYVGEAGGFQDAIAGFGFRYAILTASLAAESILEGTSYIALLRRTFAAEFETAWAVRQKLDAFENSDYDRLVESMGPEMTVEEYRRHRARRFL